MNAPGMPRVCRYSVLCEATDDLATGVVHLVLPGVWAEQLAAILDRYDTLLTRSATELRRELFEDPTVPDAVAIAEGHDYDLDVWHQVKVELLAAAGSTVHVTPPVVDPARYESEVDAARPGDETVGLAPVRPLSWDVADHAPASGDEA